VDQLQPAVKYEGTRLTTLKDFYLLHKHVSVLSILKIMFSLSVTLISLGFLFLCPCGTITARLAALTEFSTTSDNNYINLINKSDFISSVSLEKQMCHILT
jgi:hypothetical protein